MGLNMNKLRSAFASAVAASVAVAVAVVITVWAEFSPALKATLKSITGHHWVTKSYLTMLVYAAIMAAIYFKVPNPSPVKMIKSLNYLIALAFAGSIILIVFFLWHS